MNRQTRKTLIIWIGSWIGLLLILAIGIPGILVSEFPEADKLKMSTLPWQPSIKLDDETSEIVVPVFLTKEQRVETIPIEHYVRGVLAAEMPMEFELEALKAQAIAARTYIVRRIVKGDVSQVPVEGAIVTDSQLHQVYLTEAKLKEKWGLFQYGKHMDKLNKAVNETKNLIITYEGEPIQATFFSTSNGYTENSEDYWQNAIPYLRSVPSPWDKELSPRFKQTVKMSLSELYERLGISSIPVSKQNWTVLERTEGKRIKTVTIGGKVFTGREVREKLDLASSLFEWSHEGSYVTLTTFGYGHGVGMSQWGAQGMAKEGKTAEDILSHYYQDVRIQSLESTASRGEIFAYQIKSNIKN
jgi:stage II sporulation protein D